MCQEPMSESVYTAGRIEKMLFGRISGQDEGGPKIKVEIITDSEPLVESIGSTKRLANLGCGDLLEGCKRAMYEEQVSAYMYTGTKENCSDTSTYGIYSITLLGILLFKLGLGME